MTDSMNPLTTETRQLRSNRMTPEDFAKLLSQSTNPTHSGFWKNELRHRTDQFDYTDPVLAPVPKSKPKPVADIPPNSPLRTSVKQGRLKAMRNVHLDEERQRMIDHAMAQLQNETLLEQSFSGQNFTSSTTFGEFFDLVGRGEDDEIPLSEQIFFHRFLARVAQEPRQMLDCPINIYKLSLRRRPPTKTERDIINDSVMFDLEFVAHNLTEEKTISETNPLGNPLGDPLGDPVGHPFHRPCYTANEIYNMYLSNWQVSHFQSRKRRGRNDGPQFIPIPSKPDTNTRRGFVYNTGFASKKKNAFLINEEFGLHPRTLTFKDTDVPKNSFPKNNKQFYLHHVTPRYCYQIDFMFSSPLMYFVAINVSTRYLLVENTNESVPVSLSEGHELIRINQMKKSSEIYCKTLLKMIPQMRPEGPEATIYLRGDSEKAFDSAETKELYKGHNIVFVPVVTAGSSHTQLAVVDRVIRTLRDMHYRFARESSQTQTVVRNQRPQSTISRDYIDPGTMRHLVTIYNTAPHDLFKKTMGFDISPAMMEADNELLSQHTNRLLRRNHEILDSPQYYLPFGAIVKVKNVEHGLTKRRSKVEGCYYRTVGYNGGPTYQIVPVDRFTEWKNLPPYRSVALERTVPRFMLAYEND